MNAPSAPELGADVYLKDSVAGHYQHARKHVCITMPPDRQTLTNLLKQSSAVRMFYFGKLIITCPDYKNHS